MKIGLTGTVSIGKTTLVKALADLPQFKDYYISTERSKYLRDLGIPLNTDSILPGQFVFLAERASELLRGDLLTDRTVWDVCAFTLSSKSINWREKKIFVEAATTMTEYYDIIIYVDPEGVEIEDNGVREVNSEYRDKIDKVIKELLEEYKPKKLIRVKGTTEERIAIILSELGL
jgi:deoxyadenosine/deoxycytidine kinase